MRNILIATDSAEVATAVQSVLPSSDYSTTLLSSGRLVRESARRQTPDLAVVDFQIGSMGGMAVALDLKLEESGGRLPHIPVLLLLDRRADVFLAKRSDAEGWLLKPLDPIRLRRAIKALIEGDSYHDSSYAPRPALVG